MMIKGNAERVILGGGTHYIAEYEGGKLENLSTYCIESNIIGWTQGGTTLTYTPEIKQIEDDIGMVRKTFQSKANAEMKTGLLTLDVKSIAEIMSVGTFTAGTSGSGGTPNKLELGGGKEALKKYVVVFEYKDEESGRNLRVGMVATNTAALELIFSKDNETVPSVTFSAESNGVDDTIVVIEEDLPAAD